MYNLMKQNNKKILHPIEWLQDFFAIIASMLAAFYLKAYLFGNQVHILLA